MQSSHEDMGHYPMLHYLLPVCQWPALNMGTEYDTGQCDLIANVEYIVHGLSEQGVWVPFWTPKPLKRTPQDTKIFLCGISKYLNLKAYNWIFSSPYNSHDVV